MSEEKTSVEKKKRAMSSEKASKVKVQGHKDEKEFAEIIGMETEYLNGPRDKKDVIDRNGDTHSIKGAEKRWQMFLYGKDRFESDKIFKVMGGIGDGVGTLILDCLNVFPDDYSIYETDKVKYKNLLKPKMIALCGKLQNKDVFSAFLLRSMFNGGEVTYFTFKDDDKFHVFLQEEVFDILTNKLNIKTSIKRSKEQLDYQKVLLQFDNKNVGTIEIRHDSNSHYRQAVFSFDKGPISELLKSSIIKFESWGTKVVVYGKAIKKFEKEHKKYLNNPK